MHGVAIHSSLNTLSFQQFTSNFVPDNVHAMVVIKRRPVNAYKNIDPFAKKFSLFLHASF